MKIPMISGLHTEFFPASVKESENPLLIVLHGLGDSVEGYRFLPQFLGFQNLSYLFVNAPDEYYTGYSWFDIFANPAPGILRSRKLLFSLLDQLGEQDFQYDQIGFLGFSQGALMSLDIGVRYPKKLGAIVAISGFVYFLDKLPEEFSSVAKTQKFFVTHGTLDPLLPIQKSREQITQMCILGLNIRWQEYEKEHTIDPNKEGDDIRAFLRENLGCK